MRRYFLILILLLLAGCIAESIDEGDEFVFIDEDPDVPGSYSGGGHFDRCTPLNEVMEFNGVEVVMEIPVECHPLDVPFLWWGDYRDDVTVEQELHLLQEQQKHY